MDLKQLFRLREAYSFHLGPRVLLNCRASHTIPLLLSKLVRLSGAEQSRRNGAEDRPDLATLQHNLQRAGRPLSIRLK